MQRQSRTTKQRMVILDVLRAARNHPTADEVYAMTKVRIPRISLGTVYRNLDLLVRHGEIKCLANAGAQKHFDGTMREHQHIRCVRCGKIADIFSALTMPNVQDMVVENFTLIGARLEFDGICASCVGMGQES